MSAQPNQLVATQPSQEYQFKDVAPAFPSELKMLNRWIVRNASKLPFSAFEEDEHLGTIDSRDEQYQADYDTALGALEQTTKYSGLGFVFNYADGFTGVDFDDCVNAETREIRPDIQEIIKQVDSYTECSPSGTGIHIITRGWQFPIGAGKEHGGKVGKAEIYSGKRYFTVTGNHVNGTPLTVNDRDLQWLYTRIITSREFVVAKTSTGILNASSNSSCIVERKNSVITTKFETLTKGTITRSRETGGSDFAIEDANQILIYPSQSEADLALLRLLTDKIGDVESIKTEFLKSPLGQRGKATRENYLESAIAMLQASQETPADDVSTLAWDEPRPLDNSLLPVEPFKLEFLPSSLQPWAKDVAERMSVPLDFVGICGLAVLAGVVNRRAFVYAIKNRIITL